MEWGQRKTEISSKQGCNQLFKNFGHKHKYPVKINDGDKMCSVIHWKQTLNHMALYTADMIQRPAYWLL